MRTEWFIARRYLWSRRRHPFVGIISTISVVGIAVGVAALIVVISVMSGFDQDLKSRIIGLNAHLVIEKDGPFKEYTTLEDELRRAPAVKGASPYIEGQALIQKEEWGTGVLVRGIDPATEKDVTRFASFVKEGGLPMGPSDAVLGLELAKRAGLGVGSEFQILTQNAEKPAVFKVAGIFSSGMYDYDANILVLNLKSAQALFKMDGAVTGISVALKDAEKADAAKRQLQKRLGYPYFVRTWMDLNKTLFGALKLEKIVMFLILVLIILVACLNIAGSLTIMVMDKTKDIGVMKALGATRLQLISIFALDGLFIGCAGALTGFLIGGGLCVLLKRYPLIELPREIYYVDRLPVKMMPAEMALIVGVAVLLSFLSSFYPALMAGNLDPVKALRYE